jgi:hypothetical protein
MRSSKWMLGLRGVPESDSVRPSSRKLLRRRWPRYPARRYIEYMPFEPLNALAKFLVLVLSSSTLVVATGGE